MKTDPRPPKLGGGRVWQPHVLPGLRTFHLDGKERSLDGRNSSGPRLARVINDDMSNEGSFWRRHKAAQQLWMGTHASLQHAPPTSQRRPARVW